MRNMVTLFYKVKTAYIIIIRNKIEDLISWPVVQYKNDVKASTKLKTHSYQLRDIPLENDLMITEYLICDQFFLAFNGIEGLLVQGKASVFFNNIIHNAAQKLNELQTFITHNYALLNINNVLPPNLYMKSKQEISE